MNGTAELWFLVFLWSNQPPLPMHNAAACISAAAALSLHQEISIACISPDDGKHIIFTNGVMEPHPK